MPFSHPTNQRSQRRNENMARTLLQRSLSQFRVMGSQPVCLPLSIRRLELKALFACLFIAVTPVPDSERAQSMPLISMLVHLLLQHLPCTGLSFHILKNYRVFSWSCRKWWKAVFLGSVQTSRSLMLLRRNKTHSVFSAVGLWLLQKLPVNVDIKKTSTWQHTNGADVQVSPWRAGRNRLPTEPEEHVVPPLTHRKCWDFFFFPC